MKNLPIKAILFSSFIPLIASAQTKPNVIIVFADDLGYGDTGVYGATQISTPNIDALAAGGRRYTDAHSASAVCTPSRYSLMTGDYSVRGPLNGGPLNYRSGLTLDLDRKSIAGVMKEAGYATSIIGKWHLGFGDFTGVNNTNDTIANPKWNGMLAPGPLEVGFDYYFGVPQVNSGPPFVYVENHFVVGLDPDDPFVYNRVPMTDAFPEKRWNEALLGGADEAHLLYRDRSVGTDLTERAQEWIVENKDEPFFLLMPTTAIHHPFTPAENFIGTSAAGRYGDYTHELDWMVGELMTTLDENNLSDNTIFIFTSDNGGMLNEGGRDAVDGAALAANGVGHKLNGDLLGFKFGAWEGGHRVPFIVRWPNEIPANTVSDSLFCLTDIYATLAAINEVQLEQDEGKDSFNYLSEWKGTATEVIRDHVLIAPRTQNRAIIRKDNWVYIPGQEDGGFGGITGGAESLDYAGQVNSDVLNGSVIPGAPANQLYDLDADFSQAVNVINSNPTVVAELTALRTEILSSVRTAPFINYAPVPAEEISVVGDGIGYDVVGAEAVSFRSTNVDKNFDTSAEDNAYGTDAYFFFDPSGTTTGNAQDFSSSSSFSSDSSISFSAGGDFVSISDATNRVLFDDPTQAIGTDVSDWASTGIAVARLDTDGAWNEMLQIDLTRQAPYKIRVGVMAGNETTADGRWDPTGIRLATDFGTSVEVTDLNVRTTDVGMVFFDVVIAEGDSTTLSVLAQTRGGAGVNNVGSSIAGVTVDYEQIDYASFISAFNLSEAESLSDAEPFNNISNALAYAFGLPIDPVISDELRERLPSISQVDNGEATMSFSLPTTVPSDATLYIEQSNSLELGSWTEISQKIGNGAWTGTTPVTSETVVNGEVLYSLVLPEVNAERGFVRIKVVINE